jgi:hypothetical protein
MKTSVFATAMSAVLLSSAASNAAMAECMDRVSPAVPPKCVNYPDCPAPIEPPCYYAALQGIPCVTGMTTTAQYLGTSSLSAATPSGLPFQGTSMATVESQYPIVILWEFQHLTAAQLNAQFAILAAGAGHLQLARLSQLLYVETKGGAQLTEINAVAEQKLTAANYAIWTRAFSSTTATPVAQSHAAHAKAGHTAFTTNGYPVVAGAAVRSMAMGVEPAGLSPSGGGLGAPNIYMTMYEIYTEYLFTEATSETAALALTAKYAAGQLGWAWMLGYNVIGPAINTIGTSIDASFSADLWAIWADPIDAPACGGDGSCVTTGVSITVGDPIPVDAVIDLDNWDLGGGGC